MLVLSLIGLILAFTRPLKSWPVSTRQAIDANHSASKLKRLEDVHMLEVKNSDTKLDLIWISKIENASEITSGSMKSEDASTITDIRKGEHTTNNELNATLKSRVENTELNTQMTFQNPLKHHKLENKNATVVEEMAFRSSSNIILDSSVENEKIYSPANLKETPIKVINRRQANAITTDLVSNENIKSVPDNKPVSTDSVRQHENYTHVGYSDSTNKRMPSHEQLSALAKAIAEIAKLHPLIILRPKVGTLSSSTLNVTEDASDIILKFLHDEVVNTNDRNFSKISHTDAIADSVGKYENIYAEFLKARSKKVRRHENEAALDKIVEDISNKSYELNLDNITTPTTNSSAHILNVTQDISDVIAKYVFHDEVVNRSDQNFSKFVPTDSNAISDSVNDYENHTTVNYSKVEDKKVRRHEKETATDEIIEHISNTSHGLILGDKTVSTTNLRATIILNTTEDAADEEAGGKYKKETPSDKNIEGISNSSHGLILDHIIAQSTSSSIFILNVTEVTSDQTMKYRNHDEVVKNDQTTDANTYSNIAEATYTNKSIATKELNSGISSEL